MNLRQHPLSAAFPAMPSEELDDLAEDIKRHGQRVPGVVFEGMVLDGWHRYLATQKIGRNFKHVEFDGDDPIAFVLSQNLHRRHMTASQRAAAVVAATNWRPNGVSRGAKVQGFATNADMADAAQVSERTIVHAKQAHEAGLGEAVKQGEVSVKRAAEVAKLPKAKRAKAIKEPKPPKPKAADAKEFADLKAKYDDLQERYDTLCDTARDVQDKLTAFEMTEPDEQQKEIMKLQKRIVRLEGEIERLTRARNDCQAKNNELIREVKRLRKRG